MKWKRASPRRKKMENKDIATIPYFTHEKDICDWGEKVTAEAVAVSPLAAFEESVGV